MVITLLLPCYPWSSGNDEEEEAEEDVDSTGELRVDLEKQQKQVNKIARQVKEHERNYQEYLQEGANALNRQRQLLAFRARMEKSKGQLRQLDLKKATRNLLHLEYKRHGGVLKPLVPEETDELDFLSDNIGENVDNFSEMAKEVEAEIHADIEQTQEMMRELQVPSADMTPVHIEEEQIMEKIADGDASPDQYNLEDVDLIDDDSVTQKCGWEDDEFDQGF